MRPIWCNPFSLSKKARLPVKILVIVLFSKLTLKSKDDVVAPFFDLIKHLFTLKLSPGNY